MNKQEAAEIAEAYIAKMSAASTMDFAINHKITAEYPVGFVFFYNTSRFWETRELSDSVVGNGPLLVDRETGELVVLPSYQSAERSTQDYELKK